LHYEYRVNGRHQNPRTVALPEAKPIPATYMGEFQTLNGNMLTELDRIRASTVIAAPPAER
jgi:hypothetical protein